MTSKRSIFTRPIFPSSLCIATPTHDRTCNTAYVHSLLQSVSSLQHLRMSISYVNTSSSLIAEARNRLVDYFLNQTQDTHLLMIDPQISWTWPVLENLLCNSSYDMVGSFPGVLAKTLHEPDQETELAGQESALECGKDIAIDKIFSSKSVPMGLMLIRREVFRELVNVFPNMTHPAAENPSLISYFAGGRTSKGFLSDWEEFFDNVTHIGKKFYVCPWIGYNNNTNK